MNYCAGADIQSKETSIDYHTIQRRNHVKQQVSSLKSSMYEDILE